uniref:Tyrosine-protein kinase receptor n=1 Tax=Trichuris muris TaxID=70415 RepID=A0A5S6QCV7_TRIMR
MCPFFLIIFRLVSLLLLLIRPVAALEEVVCGGFDIRNSPRHFYERLSARAREQWRRCSVIEGDVRLILMTREGLTQEDFELVVMPSVREITGSLLVFQVLGLQSLGTIFPNLRIIRGNSLVYNYALVLFQNPQLREIGLTNLTEISKGGVRIFNNAELCYVNTVDWSKLCREDFAHVVVEGNKDPNLCSEKCSNQSRFCVQHRASSSKGLLVNACWNHDTCQTECPTECAERGLPCNATADPWFCCHPMCAGGCSGPEDTDCYACQHVHYEGRCLKRCPAGLFELSNRRCITRQECISRDLVKDEVTGDDLYYKALEVEGVCVLRCPPNYEEDPNDQRKCIPCKGVCLKKCFGGDVRSLSEASQFKSCNIVIGALDIMMQSGLDGNFAGKLEEYLGDIREITHYLKVSFSPSFVSLNMLRNLRIIRGQELWNEKYAISVIENQHLSKLWNFTNGAGKLKIERGKLQFHNNPRLCYRYIVELALATGLSDELHELDVSPMSNGNKAVCEELEIEIDCHFVGSDTVVLRWDSFNTTMMDHRMFLGYQLYYRAADMENVSIVENRDACHDSWKMLFYQSQERGAFLTDLKPYTLYAFYITTLMVNSPGARGGISKVVYVRTAFGHPSPVVVRSVESPSASTITIRWDPPVLPNGEVTHYMVSYAEEGRPPATDRNYCDEPPDYSVSSDRLPMTADAHSAGTSVSAVHIARGSGQSTGSNHLAAPEGSCEQLKCCRCPADGSSAVAANGTILPDHEALAAEQKERAVFENIIHNIVFVRSRHKRHSNNLPSGEENQYEDTQTRFNISLLALNSNRSFSAASPSRKLAVPVVINVTGSNFTLENLRHFTMYEIKIWACQNQSVAENFCSKREVRILKSTLPVESKDDIDEASVQVYNASDSSNDRFISWSPPEDPNGALVAYEIEYGRNLDSEQKPKRDCITQVDFERNLGFVIRDLPPGNYSFRLRALSLAQRGSWTSYFTLLIADTPKMAETIVILIAVGCSAFAVLFGVLLVTAVYRRKFKKKLPEYLLNVFSANPEYISQLEVYKPDEWELRREDIELINEIGRGTFGTVYAGRAKNVRSVCGVVFGECAVKTVSEKASIYDRWHFLIEASVMKKFDTAFIVKLYGVVSEGQPALVVMEMMACGNLKDYLRARRPDSEENENHLPPPSTAEMFQFAAEMADGMAYLEAIKFCHRDLAARNCMVSADGTCKIGDFGMARDVYVKDYYRPQGRRLMPVRWMAPEALKDAKFTSKSDIWSFGVVLWEIATLASQPYAGLSNEEVMRYVVDLRKIMEKPADCSPRLYDLMQMCWKYDPKDRPFFHELAAMLFDDLPKRFKNVSFCGKTGIRSSKISRRGEQKNFAPPQQCKRVPLDHSLVAQSAGNNFSFDEVVSDPSAPLCKNNRLALSKTNAGHGWMKLTSPDWLELRPSSGVNSPEGNGALLNEQANAFD